ncbi:MAG: PrsW family intramembrane metalloprotease [Prevotella sp.]|jgi:RsiW-degrading membrane proteinase PrsW (M82 family)
MIYVTRNTTDYGPYDESVVARFVEEGKLLMRDKARDAQTGEEGTIEDFLDRAGLHPKVKNNGSLRQQLAYIGREFIWPRKDMTDHDYTQDKRLMVLAVVGLSLSVIMLFPIGGYLAFYAVSLYFSVIWGLFFYYFFRTRQVELGTTVRTFFLTQIMVFVIFGLLYRLNIFYVFTETPFPLNIVGFVLGVGLTEEFVKMVPLLVLVRRAKEPMLPQTLVYYGLMSGIAFGVFEGVKYQTQVNIEADYTTAFILNIARLTCLPFIHALWCGICGYFVACANLYPRYRRSLYVLALFIPALLHGLYDSFASVAYIFSLAVAFCSVVLLITYLRRTNSLQQKLRK